MGVEALSTLGVAVAFVIINAGALIISELGPPLLGLFGYNRNRCIQSCAPRLFYGYG